jgi:hypothetical protein
MGQSAVGNQNRRICPTCLVYVSSEVCHWNGAGFGGPSSLHEGTATMRSLCLASILAIAIVQQALAVVTNPPKISQSQAKASVLLPRPLLSLPLSRSLLSPPRVALRPLALLLEGALDPTVSNMIKPLAGVVEAFAGEGCLPASARRRTASARMQSARPVGFSHRLKQVERKTRC